MSKPAFTPGRWAAVNQGSKAEPMMNVLAERISGRGFTHCVAICSTGDSAQEMETANAHLISAAPDMHAASEEALAALLGCREVLGSMANIQLAIDKLSAALAKAEGRS